MLIRTDEKSIVTDKEHNATSVCELCKGVKFIPVLDERARVLYGHPEYVWRPCPQCNGEAAARIHRISVSGMPENFKGARLSDFRWNAYAEQETDSLQKTVVDFINNYDAWKKEGLGLYVWSRTRGTGKTFIASIVGNELLERGKISELRFVRESDLLQMDAIKAEDRISDLREKDFLILDDIGQKTSGIDWLSDVIFRVFDWRLHNSRISIVTGNQPLSELNLDSRCVDRLNATVISLHLPEICVRTDESSKKKKAFLEGVKKRVEGG